MAGVLMRRGKHHVKTETHREEMRQTGVVQLYAKEHQSPLTTTRNWEVARKEGFHPKRAWR